MEMNRIPENLAIIKTIDYLIKALRHKYDRDREIIFDDENIEESKKSGEFLPPDNMLTILRDEKMIELKFKENKIYDRDGEYMYSTFDRIISAIDTLRLFEEKRKLLWKSQKSIINPTTLERIARWIWDSGNAESVIKTLKACEVPEYLIIYPNTKWRMADDLFRVLATSYYEEWHNLLFSIIETYLNPIRFWSIEAGIETQKYYSEYLTYDGYEIIRGKIVPIKDKRDMYDVYYESKSGKRIEVEEYDKIKDAIANTDYKKVTLLKWSDGQVERIDGERHINGDDVRFVDLQNTYEHSHIETSVYDGKVNKYIVTEKIKVDKNERE
jgi:hypothetical protein